MRCLYAVAALVLLAFAPLAAGANHPGLQQVERAIKTQMNGGPYAKVTRSVRCRPSGESTRCVLTSVRGTRLRVRVEDGRLIWEPLEG
jgi:hypothetical protein